MAFATTGNEEKKSNKKRKLCDKSGKLGHYSNECDDVETIKMSNTNNTNKKGLNILILKEDTKHSSSEDEAVAKPTFNREKEL